MISVEGYAPRAMGISGGQPHIPPQGLSERTYASLLRRSTWRLERRSGTGGWATIGVYGDERSATSALDEALGEGSGDPADYRVSRSGGRPVVWLAIGVAAVIALALVAALFVATA
jgi:hypothetical protein